MLVEFLVYLQKDFSLLYDILQYGYLAGNIVRKPYLLDYVMKL